MCCHSWFTAWVVGGVACLGLAAPAVAQDPPGAYQAADPEPTPEEVLILELINRSRANPQADALRIAPPGTAPQAGVDFDMFRKEMAEFQPAPPLVFDLNLLKAARWHSSYQLQNGQGHEEEPGKPGFTGVSFSDRAKAAGSTHRGGGAENCFIHAKDPWHSHAAFIVDYGAGPGGMQPERGHRRNILNPDYRVIGCAALQSGSELAVTHLFSKSANRYAGGVVFDDRNRSGAYDLGEGLGGLEISSGNETITSWKAGAYTLPVSGDEVTISIVLEGKKYSRKFPAGQDNIKCDIIPPSPAELATASRLVKQVTSIPESEANAARRFSGLVRLLIESESLLVDDQTAAEIEVLTAPARERLAAAQAAVRSALESDDMATAKKTIDAEKKPFQGTMALSWFQDATICAGLRARYLEWAAAAAGGKTVTDRVLAREAETMEKTLSRLKSIEWQTFVRDLIKKTLNLAS